VSDDKRFDYRYTPWGVTAVIMFVLLLHVVADKARHDKQEARIKALEAKQPDPSPPTPQAIR
jgi:hypothetical protein